MREAGQAWSSGGEGKREYRVPLGKELGPGEKKFIVGFTCHSVSVSP